MAIDDDLDTLELLSFHLIEGRYKVSIAVSGAEGIYKAQTSSPDLVILDLMLPDMDGFEVCRKLREDDATREIPILILTARSKEADRIFGFELGANDYVAKPFSPRELMLRIRNLLSVNTASKDQSHLLQVGELCIDPDGHSVTVGGEPLSLTVTEFRLLAALARQNGRVQSRESLLAEIWNGDRGVDPRTVDTHITRLREKLGKASCLVDTVYGVGYRFVKA